MGFSGIVRLLAAFMVVLTSLQPLRAAAQEGAEAVVVVSGLTSPRGFVWAGSETLLVSTAGSGGTSATVTSIANASCPEPLSSGLFSTVDDAGRDSGPGDLAVLDGQLYVAIGGSLAGEQGGISIVFGDGSTALIADLSAWARSELASALPEHVAPFAGYSLVADPDAGVLWVSDPASQQILTVTPDGDVRQVADLAASGLVPTRLALAPDGGVYAGALDATSLDAGTAKVVAIDDAGNVTDAWTGRTAVSDVAVGPDGALYALEMSEGGSTQEPGSGRLVQQAVPGEEEIIASGLPLPVAMEIGPDDAFFLAAPAFGAPDGEGVILRVAPDGSLPSFSASPECAAPPGTGAPTEEAQATEAPVSTAGPPVAGSPAPVMSEIQVGMIDLTFQPATIEVPAGTTIRWTNLGDVEHTATGIYGEFDTGVIPPGGSATVTLDAPGTYVYYCQFYPDMQATIVVI